MDVIFSKEYDLDEICSLLTWILNKTCKKRKEKTCYNQNLIFLKIHVSTNTSLIISQLLLLHHDKNTYSSTIMLHPRDETYIEMQVSYFIYPF